MTDQDTWVVLYRYKGGSPIECSIRLSRHGLTDPRQIAASHVVETINRYGRQGDKRFKPITEGDITFTVKGLTGSHPERL